MLLVVVVSTTLASLTGAIEVLDLFKSRKERYLHELARHLNTISVPGELSSITNNAIMHKRWNHDIEEYNGKQKEADCKELWNQMHASPRAHEIFNSDTFRNNSAYFWRTLENLYG
jgi:hypothetical protein